MTDKLMYIPNDDTQNYPFFRLELVVETLEYQPIKRWPVISPPMFYNNVFLFFDSSTKGTFTKF